MESLSSDKYQHKTNNSSKTIIHWKNDILPDENVTTCINLLNVRKHHKEIVHKSPRGLSENYLHMIRQTADKLVNTVIEISELSVQNCLKPYRNIVTNKIEDKYTTKCRDMPLLTSLDSGNSLLSKSGWFNENGLLDDFSATQTIYNYIKDDWALDTKYLFDVVNTATSKSKGLTRHNYKVEFSVPTNEYPIPQITVCAYFTVDVSPLQSLPIYTEYRLESDRRVYVVGKHPFNKKRFEQLFKIKRDSYMNINRYPGWSSLGPSCSGPDL